MRGFAIFGVALGLGLTLGVGSNWVLSAQDDAASAPPVDLVSSPAAHFSHQERETFELVLGIRPLGRDAWPTAHEETRDILKIPRHYGKLQEITTVNSATVLWYRCEEGLRNVVIPAADERAYLVTRTKAMKRELELKPNK